MADVHEDLLRIEQELAASSPDAYRRHLAEEARIVFPGHALDRDACIAAIEQSPPWDEWEITDAETLALGAEAALLSYRWRSQRGDAPYSALMTSVYARRDGSWRLVLHQQTPDPA